MLMEQSSLDEREQWLLKITHIVRYDFRLELGSMSVDKYGYLLDRCLSKIIHSFSYWIDYPNGDHCFKESRTYVSAAVISKDGCGLFTGLGNHCIQSWDLSQYEFKQQWQAHKEGILDLALHSATLVSCSEDGSIGVWNARNGTLIRRMMREESGCVYSVSFNDDEKGDLIAAGSDDGTITVWSVKNGECVRVLRRHDDLVHSVIFIHDDSHSSCIISGAYDWTVKVWNQIKQPELSQIANQTASTIRVKSQYIQQVCLNGDRSLLSCISHGHLTTYSWPSMDELCSLDAPISHCGCFHPWNSDVLVVGDSEHYCLRMYHASEGCLISEIKGHTDTIYALRFTPDGSRLVSVSLDGTTRMWDLSDRLTF